MLSFQGLSSEVAYHPEFLHVLRWSGDIWSSFDEAELAELRQLFLSVSQSPVQRIS